MNIDRIAREMVDVEPSADLEARIRSRIRNAEPVRVTTWWVWRVAMPVAAAAVVTIAIAVRGPASEVARPELTTPAIQTASAQPATPSTGVVPASQSVPTSSRPKVLTSRRSTTRTSELSSEELAWMDRRMPALDPVTALQMDHLGASSIQPEALAITPLIMPPVTTEGSGIERRNDR